jgi:deoxyribodipyrimidine photo-lyase
MKTTIVWFKTDLRVHANAVLHAAINKGDRVVPVYCIDDAHFGTTSHGFNKTGAFRARFLLEALADLDRSLKRLGSGLIVVRGKPAVEIANIAREYGATSVVTAEEVAPEELSTLNAVGEKLAVQGCALTVIVNSSLYDTSDLPFAVNAVPDIFTAYRQKTEAYAKVRPVVSMPANINSPELPDMSVPTLADLGLSEPASDARAAIQFQGGETAALARLQHYLWGNKSVLTYKETRNGLVGADYSTKFSAWLSMGCLSARYVYSELKKFEQEYGANDSTYWVVFELMWRDYFRLMMMKYGNRFFLKGGIRGKDAPGTRHDEPLLQRWIDGQTGEEFVDANMRELKSTGFMSNRGRQNVASYLCHDLKLDWRYGAAYFEHQLTDYDVCSNWCNWAYVAGVGNDPRPNRHFNIQKQSEQYDGDGRYRNLWRTAALVPG